MAARSGKPRRVVIALAGNPGTGKTTLYNALTGAHEETGNRPGVTVESRERCAFRPGGTTVVVDLPGTYDLGATTELEAVACRYLTSPNADAVIDVVDAANLERNLYLTVRLLEAGTPLVVALNFMDRVRPPGPGRGSGRRVARTPSPAALGASLGVPVIGTIATRGEGVVELLAAATRAATARRRRGRPRHEGLVIDYGPEVEAALNQLVRRLEPMRPLGWPSRWVAVRLLEGDPGLLRAVSALPGGAEVVAAADDAVISLEARLGGDVAARLAARRYDHIRSLVASAMERTSVGTSRPPGSLSGDDREPAPSFMDRVDQVATHRHAGLVLLGVVMWGIFKLTFTLGGPLIDLVSHGVAAAGVWLRTGIAASGAGPLVTSLVVDGLLGGVGSVLVFVPPIFLLFAALALLEESGYVTRASFVMDRFMRSLGLQGRAFVPLVLGFGCNVPAILAARTLESRRDRLLTILISPLMSCSGRLPVYTLFAGAFFGASQGLVLFSLYLLGVVMAVVMARLITRRLLPGESAELMLELTPYRWPSPGRILRHAWNNAWAFIQKAGTVIAGGVVVMWALANLPWGVEYASRESVLGQLGSAVGAILAPAGLGSWENGAALLFGFWSKEFVVAALGVVHGAGEQALPLLLQSHFTPLTAVSFMVLALLYAPCLATVLAIRRESGSWKWAAFTVGYSVALGLALAALIYQVGSWLGL